MKREELFQKLAIKNEKKILLLVLDGVGDIPDDKGKTPLEIANTKNIDNLANKASCGRTIPVLQGITPGSGPAHFSLFGYDPIKYSVGRGILEALGIDVHVEKNDLVARGNYCTLSGDMIVKDRRAGRISTEKNKEITKKINENINSIQGVKVKVFPGKEHRFVVKFTHQDLSENVNDADPQINNKPLIYPEPSVDDNKASFTAKIAKEFMNRVINLLKDSYPVNGLILRGFSEYPDIPPMQKLFKLNPAAIANYPMYRGLAKLVGMEVLDVGAEIDDEIETLKKEWDNFDYFFVHIKKTDSYGEDGNIEKKVEIIEKVDSFIPEILDQKPDVIAITGDHSTPCPLKSHSWHPNPFLLYSKYIIPDEAVRFTEKECAKGILGNFYSIDILPLLLANSLKLNKYGA